MNPNLVVCHCYLTDLFFLEVDFVAKALLQVVFRIFLVTKYNITKSFFSFTSTAVIDVVPSCFYITRLASSCHLPVPLMLAEPGTVRNGGNMDSIHGYACLPVFCSCYLLSHCMHCYCAINLCHRITANGSNTVTGNLLPSQ